MEPIVLANLNDPDKNSIAVVLEEELKQNYTEASVQCVTSPNLSDPPFNLAAPGICGNTALLDFGHESYFHLPFTELNVYRFEQFLRVIDRNRSNSFIFGHGISSPRLSRCTLSEIVLNALFLPATHGRIEGTSSSGFTIIEMSHRKCKKQILHLSQLECAVQGTYFLSEGLITDETILKVCAKGPHLDNEPFYGSKRFIYSMQHALEQEFGSENFVALGGVYTVNNVFWEHQSIRNEWEPPTTREGICLVNTPETMITTFTSSNELHPINLEHPIRLNSCQSIHSLTHHSASEKHPLVNDENQQVEYVGYFCPAKTLYRINEPPQ